MNASPIDWTNTDSIRAFVSTLDTSQRHSLSTALRDADSAENVSTLLALVRKHLAENPSDGEPIGVRFHTMDYDNGNFLTDFATVLYADGDVDDTAEFGALVSEALTDEYGCVGSQATLAVDLRTGTLDFEDTDHHTIWQRFGADEPMSTTWQVIGGRPEYTMDHVIADTEAEAIERAGHRPAVARYLTATAPNGIIRVVQLTVSQARRVA